MRLAKITNRNAVIGLAIIMALLVVAAPVRAVDTVLSLPSTPVTVTVSDGTESYFVTTLSNVPSNCTVTNTANLGWCIDASALMTRNQTFEVMLYSSLNPPSGNLLTARWDMVNYILNHKQGNANDTQEAIWYFINNTVNYNGTPSAVAQLVINDALANGTGFAPQYPDVAAVICFPQNIPPGTGPVQDSIIEIQVPQIPEFPSIAIPLIFAIAILTAAVVYTRKRSPRKLQLRKLPLNPKKRLLRQPLAKYS